MTLRVVAACLISLVCADTASAQAPTPKSGAGGQGQFRVCADPENMPHSNQKQEGFENKIADLIAKEFGASTQLCLVGPAARLHPEHDERDTRGRAMRRRHRRPRGLRSGPHDEAVLPIDLRLRVSQRQRTADQVAGRPDTQEGQDRRAPARRRLHESAAGARACRSGEWSATSLASARSTRRRIPRVRSSTPSRAARSTSRSSGVPRQDTSSSRQRVPLAMVPVPSGKGDLPFEFGISMGVKPDNDALRVRLEKVIDTRRAEITKILNDYNVPLVERKAGAETMMTQHARRHMCARSTLTADRCGLSWRRWQVLVWNESGFLPTPGLSAQATSTTYRNVYDGWKWWHVYCYRCHGTNAIGDDTAPNLIEPNAQAHVPLSS